MYQTNYPNGNFIPSKIELHLTEYKVKGFSIIEDENNEKKAVNMKSFSFPAEGIANEYELKLIIQSLLNCNGCACKELRGSKCSIYAVYENKNMSCQKKEFFVRNEIVSKYDNKPLNQKEINLINSESCWFVC